MNVEQDVQKFKFELLRKIPFYGDIVMRLPIEADSSILTACTNGAKICYNPKFFKSLESQERYFVLMHEILHVLLLHCRRGEKRDPKIWNTACDIVVNQMLTNMHYELQNRGIFLKKPKDGIYAAVSKDITTEELYEQIAALNKKRKKNSKNLIIKKNFVWGGDGDKNMMEIQTMDDLEDYEVLLNGALSDEIRMNEQMIKGMIKESLQKNRSSIGSNLVPGQLIRLTESKKLNWRLLLKNFLNQKISDEASYSTPERKYLHMDMILPGYSMTDDELDEIWAFIDSSGSISENEMNQFLTQLYRISKEFHCVANICYWDTKVTDVYRNIRNEKDILKCKPNHSGGTDINCVYNWIQENKVKPDVMVILTDGAFGKLTTPAFKKKYGRQTILVVSSQRFISDEMKKIGKIAAL